MPHRQCSCCHRQDEDDQGDNLDYIDDADERWGPITRQEWRCPHCGRTLSIRQCLDPNKANYLRLYVACEGCHSNPHPVYFRYCNHARETGAGASHAAGATPYRAASAPAAPARRGATRSTSPSESGPRRHCPICGTSRVAGRCGRASCRKHCEVAGGCTLHRSLSDTDLHILGVQPTNSTSASPSPQATPAPEDQSPARDAHAPAHAPAHASSARTRMEHPAVHDEPPASAPSARARMKRPARDQSPDEPPASAPSARARMKRPARDQSPDKPPASAREVAGEEPPISARARMKRPARDQSSDSGRPRKVARPTITPPPPSSQEDDDLKAAIQASLADRVSHSAHAPPHAPSHAPPHAPSSSSSISHGAGSSMRRGSGSSVRRGGGGGAGSSSQRSAVPSVSLGAGTTSSSCSRGPPPSHASSSSTSISHSAGPSSVWHGTVPSVWRGAGPSSVRLSLSTPAWVPAVASGSGTMSAPASGPSQTPSSYEDDLQAALEASISEMSLPQSILRCMEPGHPGCENCSHTDEDDDDEYLAALEASRAEAVHTAAALETRASSPWGNLSDSGQSEHEALRDSTLALLADLDRLSPAPPSEGSPYLDANGREMLAVVRTSIALMRSETPDSLFDEDSDEEEALLDADATLRDAPLLTFSGSESDASLPNRPSPPRIKIEHVDIDLTLDDSDDDDVVPPLPQAPPRRLATPRRLVKIERVDIDLTLDDDEEDAAVHV